MKRFWVLAVLLVWMVSCCACLAEDSPEPYIMDPDETFAATREEAYALLKERYQAGMDHYAEMQAMDDEMLAGYEGYEGSSPLYEQYLDVTGDGEPEMLFLATREGLDEWDSDSADLYVYTWKDNHAEQILFIGMMYVIAGDGPWYEISTDADNPGNLLVRYGCNAPGTTELYRLYDGRYFCRVQAVSAFCDYEAVDDINDGMFWYVDGAPASKADYDAALAAMTPENAVRIAWANEIVP